MRVLAVIDDPQALRYIRDTLAGLGYPPAVTGNPQEALHLMEGERPQLPCWTWCCPTSTAST